MITIMATIIDSYIIWCILYNLVVLVLIYNFLNHL